MRVRSITFKETGQRIEVIRRAPHGGTYERLRNSVSDLLTRLDPRNVAGYAVVCWEKDGAYWTILRADDGSVVPEALTPSFVKDVLQRRLSEKDAEDIIYGPKPGA